MFWSKNLSEVCFITLSFWLIGDRIEIVKPLQYAFLKKKTFCLMVFNFWSPSRSMTKSFCREMVVVSYSVSLHNCIHGVALKKITLSVKMHYNFGTNDWHAQNQPFFSFFVLSSYVYFSTVFCWKKIKCIM